MKTLTQEQLNSIIDKHQRWLLDAEGGEHANLQNANLQNANLQGCDLRYANLQYANLQDANLQDANLWNAIGNNQQIKTLQAGKYVVNFTKDRLQIGCKNYSYADWWSFDDSTIAAMDNGALVWWQVWKPVLQQMAAAFEGSF